MRHQTHLASFGWRWPRRCNVCPSPSAELATALAARKEDANDHNLPLLIWYGLIPVADENPDALVTLAAQCELPLTRKFVARRLTLKTVTDTLNVERIDVETIEESSLSMMPEGLLESLLPDQGRDLIAYLMHPTQAPLPANGQLRPN